MAWPWKNQSNSSIGEGVGLNGSGDENEDEETTHRKRVSQILRYISSMQTQNVNEEFPFVRPTNRNNNFATTPFFQDDDGTPIIFST